MAKTIDILGFGEPLMELSEQRGEQPHFRPGHGGDTSNATIAAARQGARTAYFTHLGNDAFGRDFLGLWDREGVDRSAVKLRDDSGTGLYFITYGPDGHEFTYRREGSAASRVLPADVPEKLVASARVLHVSGISQAISPGAADAVFHAIALARKHGTLVSYDPNLRLKLWPLDRARAIIHAAMTRADIARPALDDARQLTGRDTPEAVCDFYLELGAKIVAVTMGKDGTMVAAEGRRELIPARRVKVVDATGAGDAFDGAFLAEYLRGGDPFAAAVYANAAAALKTLGYGAVDPIPKRERVEAFMREG